MEQLSKEQQVLDLLEIFKQASVDVIGVSRSVFDMVSDWNEAQILSELIYWTSPSQSNKTKLRVIHDGFRWLACSRIEWWERRRLTTREVDRALIRLINKNLVVKHTYLFSGKTTLHLRLNVSEFMKKFFEVAKVNLEVIEDIAPDQELMDSMTMMGWSIGENTDRITKVVTPCYQNGNSINSNIHSRLLSNEENKKTELHLTTEEELAKFREFSKSYGKPKPEKKPKVSLTQKDYADADMVVQSVVASSAKSKGDTDLPERYTLSAKWFTDHSGMAYFRSQKSTWISAFEDWDKLGVVENDVLKAVQKLRSLGYSINSPKSLTQVLNGIVAERKAAGETKKDYNPWR